MRLPDAQASQHDTIAVSTMQCDIEDTGVTPLTTELSKLLTRRYNSVVEIYVIQDQPPTGATFTHTVTRRLVAFTDKYEGAKSLLIYSYSGHA